MLATLRRLLGSPDLSSRRWVWEQYDHLVMGRTIQRPGGDAAVVRLDDKGRKGLAVTCDCTPRYCLADPIEGGRQAVAETWRNLTAVGARPLAITDNMNFGNPQRPEIMGQFVGCIEGMAEAARALDFPVVSGNVSLYNETNGKGILPTPVIGGVGLVDDVARSVSIRLAAPGHALLVIGKTKGHLGQSIYLREIEGREEGTPPPVDLPAERRNGDFARRMIGSGLVFACHDCSDGGLLVALAEMAMASGIGAELLQPEVEADIPAHAYWFGEDQARYLIEVAPGDLAKVREAATGAGVAVVEIGRSGGSTLTLAGHGAISLEELGAAHQAFFPALMDSV